MPVNVTTTWHPKPDSIWTKLASRLGREPTTTEAADEVRRIIREARETSREKR